jgi:anti-anti-sigma factor
MTRPANELDRDGRLDHSRFEVRLRTHRRTVLIQLYGELDLVTVPQLTAAFDSLNLDGDGFRHVVLDLRGLTFMDAAGIHELIRQRSAADANRHNLGVVRGRPSIRKLLEITAADASLVLVDSPDDLAPPTFGSGQEPPGSASDSADTRRRAQITLVPTVTEDS